ncbi:hypothetical protein [Bradyrhizobium sp. 27S5]|uniref:hypothetical protein n=1 Tax=Bradyrhizobium sp. 27S5 TaxID=3139728 RepID=UPI0030D49D9C
MDFAEAAWRAATDQSRGTAMARQVTTATMMLRLPGDAVAGRDPARLGFVALTAAGMVLVHRPGRLLPGGLGRLGLRRRRLGVGLRCGSGRLRLGGRIRCGEHEAAALTGRAVAMEVAMRAGTRISLRMEVLPC